MCFGDPIHHPVRPSAGPSPGWQGRLGNPVAYPLSQTFPARSIHHNSLVHKQKGVWALAGGLPVKNGRGNWTPIELFARGVGALKPEVQQLIMAA